MIKNMEVNDYEGGAGEPTASSLLAANGMLSKVHAVMLDIVREFAISTLTESKQLHATTATTATTG